MKVTETFYCWRERVNIDGQVRLLYPRRDPNEYEYPFDLLFETPEEARQALVDHGISQTESKSWRLCLTTTEEVD